MNFVSRVFERLVEHSHTPRRRKDAGCDRFEVATVVRCAIDTARPHVEAAEHQLLIELPADRVWVKCDPARLAQAVTTLIINAGKYMPERGIIEVSVEQTPTEVCIYVRDQGPGIPEDLLYRIFSGAPRAQMSRHAPGGLFVSLNLVKQMVELLDGTVTAANRRHGSEFVIHLPLETARAQKGEPVRRIPQSWNTRLKALSSLPTERRSV